MTDQTSSAPTAPFSATAKATANRINDSLTRVVAALDSDEDFSAPPAKRIVIREARRLRSLLDLFFLSAIEATDNGEADGRQQRKEKRRLKDNSREPRS